MKNLVSSIVFTIIFSGISCSTENPLKTWFIPPEILGGDSIAINGKKEDLIVTNNFTYLPDSQYSPSGYQCKFPNSIFNEDNYLYLYDDSYVSDLICSSSFNTIQECDSIAKQIAKVCVQHFGNNFTIYEHADKQDCQKIYLEWIMQDSGSIIISYTPVFSKEKNYNEYTVSFTCSNGAKPLDKLTSSYIISKTRTKENLGLVFK